MCMRHRDYIFDRSVSKKSRLIPSNYMYRLTEALDSLPDTEESGNETKVRVIEHSYNKSFAAIISAAAVCMLVVTGGFLASRSSDKISGGPEKNPYKVPASSTSLENQDVYKPIVSVVSESKTVTSFYTVTSVPEITSLNVSESSVPVTKEPEENKDKEVLVSTEFNDDVYYDLPENDDVNNDDYFEEQEQEPEHHEPPKNEQNDYPENNEQKNDEKPSPEKPEPNKDRPDSPKENDADKGPGARPVPPTKNTDTNIHLSAPIMITVHEKKPVTHNKADNKTDESDETLNKSEIKDEE